jgi:hypothetical protein
MVAGYLPKDYPMFRVVSVFLNDLRRADHKITRASIFDRPVNGYGFTAVGLGPALRGPRFRSRRH